jgi:hypothetical protein
MCKRGATFRNCKRLPSVPETAITVQCNDCKKVKSLLLSQADWERYHAGSKFRCDCGGEGRARYCEDCGEVIPAQRLEIMSNTRMCTDCAEKAQGNARRFIADLLGSREAFKRDRGSWRR